MIGRQTTITNSKGRGMIGSEQPTIVVLDGVPLNPGDLTWEALEKLGSATIYERTAEDEVIARSMDAHALLTNKTPLTGETLRCLKSLRYIGVLATGYNIVDVDAARALGITVTNIPTYGTASVAQFVFALLFRTLP